MANELFSQLERLKLATGTHTDTSLATIMGFKQGAISSAKGRNKIPDNWFVKVSKAFGVNLNWLVTGEEPMRLGEAALDQAAPMSATGSPNMMEKLVLAQEKLVQAQERELILVKQNAALELEITALKAENLRLNDELSLCAKIHADTAQTSVA